MIPYLTDDIRRQDRILDPSHAFRLLEEGEYGVLSLCGPDGPYGFPISYVWDGEDAIYFHCAMEGKKLTLITPDCRAGFTVVGKTQVLPAKFSTNYESIILTGILVLVEEEPDKRKGLELLIRKYSPEHTDTGMKYIAGSIHKTAVLKFIADGMSGKSR